MRTAPLTAAVLAILTSGCPSNGGGGKGSSCPAPVGTTDDADGDLLTDTREVFLGTDPGDPDTDGDGFGDYAEDAAGTNPLDDASAPPSTQVASVRQITSESELIGGPAAQGRVGDWLLENDRIRAIVQDVGREQMAIGKFGGGLIDADVIRASGPGVDRVGSVVGVFALSATAHPDRVVVVRDGSDGGPVVLRTCGEELPFEYLDLEATVDAFGLGIAYDSNRDFDVGMSTDFVLAPGSDTIEVISTVANNGKTFNAPVMTILDSGAAEEVFLTNYQGFGALGISDILDPQPPVRYTAYIGSGAAWGYVAEAEPNAAINVFGITAVVPGYSSPLDVITSDPDDGPGGGMLQFKKGGRVSWRRGIVITDGANATEGISAEYVRRHEPASSSLHTGNVGDGLGPISGARVVALRRGGPHDRAPLSVTQTDENGDYSFFLPDGDYYIAADVTGRDFPDYSSGQVAIDTLTKGTTITAAEVAFSNLSALPNVTFANAARLTVNVIDVATGLGVPSKITVVGSDPSPSDWIFHDLKDNLPSAVNIAYDAANGVFDVPIEPGTYDVYASRGMEWSRNLSPVTMVAGQSTSLALSIGRVVDTPGWISGDFHVHMMNSPDSGVTFTERVLSGVADGLDVIVATDHDFITDLTPLISSMGLSSEIASTQGEEISTTAFGHFIAFPLTPDEDSATRGAYQWTGEAGALNAKSPEVMFTEIEANHPGPQVQLVCHPRGDPLTAYYDAVELNTVTLATERDPEDMRIPRPADYTEADTGLFYAGFDAQEVMNNPDESVTRRNAWMNDIFSFLSHGLTVAAIGDSDSHSVFSSPLGWPRTYVKLADDAPANFGSNQEAFAQAVKDGKAVLANGPHLRVTAAGDSTGGPGDLVLPRAADDRVTVTIELEMPDWISVDKVRLYLNTPNTGAPAGSAVETAPVAFDEFDVVVTTTDAGFGLSKNVATITTEVPVSPNGDAWLVVTASGDATPTLFPVVTQSAQPFALANAIYLDGNRNGAWNAPGGVTAGVSLTATPKPVRFGRDEILENLEDIREQFHALGADDH